jgi:hypothetical protein
MTEQEHRPILESYWVVPGRLLAGEYPAQFSEDGSRKRLEALVKAGFNRFIDLTQADEADEALPYRERLIEIAKGHNMQVIHLRFPIGDFGLPAPEQMNSILDAIDEELQSGHKIYLHCLGGIGRTGTTVGCYLVRHGMTGTEALNQLSNWWRNVPKSRYHTRSPETAAQVDFVLHWTEHDKNR